MNQHQKAVFIASALIGCVLAIVTQNVLQTFGVNALITFTADILAFVACTATGWMLKGKENPAEKIAAEKAEKENLERVTIQRNPPAVTPNTPETKIAATQKPQETEENQFQNVMATGIPPAVEAFFDREAKTAIQDGDFRRAKEINGQITDIQLQTAIKRRIIRQLNKDEFDVKPAEKGEIKIDEKGCVIGGSFVLEPHNNGTGKQPNRPPEALSSSEEEKRIVDETMEKIESGQE